MDRKNMRALQKAPAGGNNRQESQTTLREVLHPSRPKLPTNIVSSITAAKESTHLSIPRSDNSRKSTTAYSKMTLCLERQRMDDVFLLRLEFPNEAEPVTILLDARGDFALKRSTKEKLTSAFKRPETPAPNPAWADWNPDLIIIPTDKPDNHHLTAWQELEGQKPTILVCSSVAGKVVEQWKNAKDCTRALNPLQLLIFELNLEFNKPEIAVEFITDAEDKFVAIALRVAFVPELEMKATVKNIVYAPWGVDNGAVERWISRTNARITKSEDRIVGLEAVPIGKINLLVHPMNPVEDGAPGHTDAVKMMSLVTMKHWVVSDETRKVFSDEYQKEMKNVTIKEVVKDCRMLRYNIGEDGEKGLEGSEDAMTVIVDMLLGQEILL